MTSSTPRRSRRKPAVSVLKVAESALVAQAITQGMFNVDLRTFIMGGGSAAGVNPTGGQMITASELLSGLTGGSAGTSGYMKTVGTTRGKYWGGSLGEQLTSNLKDNGAMLLFNLVAIPTGFKIAKRVLAKPLLNPINRQMRNLGIKEVKV